MSWKSYESYLIVHDQVNKTLFQTVHIACEVKGWVILWTQWRHRGMSGKIHVPASLRPGKEHEVPIEWEDGLIQQLLWMFWSRELCRALLGIEPFCMICLACVLVCDISFVIHTASREGTCLYSPSEISL